MKLGLEHYGFEVVTACNGAEALLQFKAHSGKFDAILTDNEMPQMNGLEFVRSIFHEGFKGRIVVMSGNFKPEELQAYQSYPISSFVHKPLDLISIIAAL
jgi:CheY-like chemotaxis protein